MKIKIFKIILSVILLICTLWYFTITRYLIIQMVTIGDNVYHDFSLGHNESISFTVNNPFPAKIDYAVYLDLEFIDGGIKLYPNGLSNGMNDEEFDKQRNILGINKNVIYPINLQLMGYDKHGKIYLQKQLSNRETYWTTAGRMNNGKDFGGTTILYFIRDLPYGKHRFEIKDISNKITYFNEIKAGLKIIPYTIIR